MTQVTIYTTTYCPYCDRAKALCSRLGVSYTEVRLDQDPELFAKLSRENKGWRTVPMIFIGEKFIGGFTDLEALHNQGSFLPLLDKGTSS